MWAASPAWRRLHNTVAILSTPHHITTTTRRISPTTDITNVNSDPMNAKTVVSDGGGEVQHQTARLLRRLVGRAKEALLTSAIPTTTTVVKRGTEKAAGALTKQSNRIVSSRITNLDETGLFDVEWKDVSLQAAPTPRSRSSDSQLTPDAAMMALCKILAVTLKNRRNGAVGDFFSHDVSNIRLPLYAGEAAVAPLSRQVRFWGELREWHELVACAAVTFDRVSQHYAEEDALRRVLGEFLDALDALSLPRETEMTVKGKRHGGENNMHAAKKSARSQHDTLSNALWRVSMLCRLTEGVMLQGQSSFGRPNSTEGDRSIKRKKRPDKGEEVGTEMENSNNNNNNGNNRAMRMQRVVYYLVSEIQKRVFTVHDANSHLEPLEGLEALLIKAFHHCSGQERHGKHHTSMYKGALGDALLSCCAAYCKITPIYLATPLAQRESEDVTRSRECCTVKMIRTIRHCWLQQKTVVHHHGIRLAFWWLRLIPILFETLFDTITHLSGSYPYEVQAGIPGSHTVHNNNNNNNNRRSENHSNCCSRLDLVQTELISTISAMLYFDENAFEERKAIFSSQHGTGNNTSGTAKDNVTGDVDGVDDARLGRPRSGRSLFKKGDEDGVLLPSTTEATRKSSRFSSRRLWEDDIAAAEHLTNTDSNNPGNNNNNSNKDGGTSMDTSANSPLFDIIVASKDAVMQLSDAHGVDLSHRPCALENTWLSLLIAYRRVEEISAIQPDGVAGVGSACESKPQGGTSRRVLPFFVTVSLRLFAAALAAAVQRVYEMADPLYTRDVNIHRAVGLAIVAGTQETLLRNHYYTDALASNWWLRSGAPLLLQQDPSHNLHSVSPFQAALEENLVNLLVQRAHCSGNSEWLKHSTETALQCLSHASWLSPLVKQWTSALVLSNIRAATHEVRVGGVRDASLTTMREWVLGAFSSFLKTLMDDAELLLLNGYAGFIDALFEMHFRLDTDQNEMMLFGDKYLLKLCLPAVLGSLAKSAEEDDAETHSATCESALFVLAELSRFASWPNIRLETVLRSDDNDLLIRTAVYCLRHARRGGGKRASGYGLPAAQLPREVSAIAGVMKSSRTAAYLLTKGNRSSYLQILDLSNRLLPFSRVQSLYSGRESSCITALQHYLQGLHRVPCSSSLSSPSSPFTSSFTSTSVSVEKQLMEESVKCLTFMASTSISAHVLGYLVRFMEHYLREQERLSRTPLDVSPSLTAATGGVVEAESTSSTMRREKAMSSLARVEEAPLVLLDYMGYLSSAGSWTMVTWAFNLAETSLKIRRKRQLATTTSVEEVALTAILSQLRALSVPTTPKLPHNMLRSILCLSDMISDSSLTLLGFDRGSPLQGLLRHATRGEYRTMFFAIKQAVVLLQRASVKYRGTAHTRRKEDGVVRNAKDTDIVESEPGEQQQQQQLSEMEEGEEGGIYFTTVTVNRSPEEERQFRMFFDCLVVCFDAVLDAIRSCALQQDALDDELREVLMLALQTLSRVLHGCVRAILQIPVELQPQFHAERAQVLWVSLCVAALLGKVVAVDYSRVCFTGNIRRATDSLLDTIWELVEKCLKTSSNSNHSNKNSRGECKETLESKTPLLDTLTESLQSILRDIQVSHRLAVRLGLGMRERTDMTALLTSLRTLAVASARYKPAGCVLQRVWRTLCEEVVRVKKSRGPKGKRDSRSTSLILQVPSKEELRLLLESFRDLENELRELVALRETQGRHSDFVVEWACESASLVVETVTENPSLLHVERPEEGVEGGITHDKSHHGATDELALDAGSSAAALMESYNTNGMVDIDAAVLLEGGRGSEGTITNAEAIEALIRQCRRVRLSSVTGAVSDSASTIPQTSRIILTHFNCLLIVFHRCTLREIVSFPSSEVIFSSFDSLTHWRSPVPVENRRKLWAHLTSQWRLEFLEPDSPLFEERQRELLQLVRRLRSLTPFGERGNTTVTGTNSNNNNNNNGIGSCNENADTAQLVGALFSLEGNVMARLARHNAGDVLEDVELPYHDDIHTLLGESRGGCNARTKKSQFCEQQEEYQEARVPLDVLLTILGDLPRGLREEPELEELARTVVTYVARQHVLLRPRCDGNAENVIKFMELPHHHGPRLYQRRRLPLSCASAAAVKDWFLSSTDRQRVTAAMKAVGISSGSAEQSLFEYMRSSCLYLHLLAFAVNVCHHFRILGSMATSTSRSSGSGRADSSGGGDAGRSHGRRGGEEDGGEGSAVTALSGAYNRYDTAARLAERRTIADARQTDVEGVNANLLENILLHFLNVTCAMMDHADVITHRAISIAIAPNCDTEEAQKAIHYADELRMMVVVVVQDTLRLLLRSAPGGFSLARRVAHRIISRFSCDVIPITTTTPLSASSNGINTNTGDTHNHKQRHIPPIMSSISTVALENWRSKRPELFLRSPTLLAVLSPSFFNEVLSQHIRSALGVTVTQVVASLHFYLRRPDAHLAPLMAATTGILSNTYTRNAALRIFCEELCEQIVGRDSFHDALAPPTVASVQQGAAGSVPNEVLIPFLAAICREDVFVKKNALAVVLYRSMSLRPDVFGQPPTEDRFSKLALARRNNSNNNASGSTSVANTNTTSKTTTSTTTSVMGGDGSVRRRLSLGLSPTDVVLESPLTSDPSTITTTTPIGNVLNDDSFSSAIGEEEQGDVDTLTRFKADQADQTASLTHKRAITALSLTLAEVMETAMHFAAMRQLTLEDYKKATTMIRAADDARHERVATFRSSTPVATRSLAARDIPSSDVSGTSTSLTGHNSTSSNVMAAAAGHPDAALHIEDPMHFGVVMLHIRFALRKIIHASMRRLAPQQGPKTLSMMIEMLREVDPKWHPSPNHVHRCQSDTMLAGTLRVLVARSVVCVELAGGAGDAIGGGAGGIAISASGLQRMERALLGVQRWKQNHHNGNSSNSNSNNNNNNNSKSNMSRGSSHGDSGVAHSRVRSRGNDYRNSGSSGSNNNSNVNRSGRSSGHKWGGAGVPSLDTQRSSGRGTQLPLKR